MLHRVGEAGVEPATARILRPAALPVGRTRPCAARGSNPVPRIKSPLHHQSCLQRIRTGHPCEMAVPQNLPGRGLPATCAITEVSALLVTREDGGSRTRVTRVEAWHLCRSVTSPSWARRRSNPPPVPFQGTALPSELQTRRHRWVLPNEPPLHQDTVNILAAGRDTRTRTLTAWSQTRRANPYATSRCSGAPTASGRRLRGTAPAYCARPPGHSSPEPQPGRGVVRQKMQGVSCQLDYLPSYLPVATGCRPSAVQPADGSLPSRAGLEPASPPGLGSWT
jgi:hypothetical protein